jgi:threonine dehydratase
MPLVSLDAIRTAAARVCSVVRRTPVLDVSEQAGRSLFLKCEPQQPGGAFKIRGALNMIARLAPEELRRGVITFSSGNHGQAVALAASKLGTRAVVVMPTTAPTIKLEGVRRWGAEVILEGSTSADRRRRAESEAAAQGLIMVPPFDHEWIIEGQGTCGLEILEQVPDVEIILVPVGGGGLVSGVAAAVKQSRPDVMVIGVEPAGAAKMTASLAAGRPVTLDHTSSIADGLMPVRPGDHTFEHVRAFVDQIVTVSDDEIARAALWVFFEAKQVVEPSGAATVAAVLNAAAGTRLADKNRKVVAILSGGNVSPQTLADLARSVPDGAMR